MNRERHLERQRDRNKVGSEIESGKEREGEGIDVKVNLLCKNVISSCFVIIMALQSDRLDLRSRCVLQLMNLLVCISNVTSMRCCKETTYAGLFFR